jgi:hypothetical protein
MAKRFNGKNLLTVVSVAILVGTEIIAAALAFAWAVGGLLELGQTVTQGLLVLALLLGSYAVWRFAKNAARIEPIYHTEK